ncbi:MAG: hypothetical protein QMD50_02240 [Patescibacteria group bacterium]|nr:hypothetical protein [Patescibacteria group bacterium]
MTKQDIKKTMQEAFKMAYDIVGADLAKNANFEAVLNSASHLAPKIYDELKEETCK